MEHIINQLIDNSVDLYLDNGKLKAKVKKAGLNENLTQLIKDNKDALIAYLVDKELADAQYSRNHPPLTKRNSTGAKVPLSFSQQRLWFITQLQPDSPEYNMPYAFEISGRLDLNIVKRVFTKIIQRHEILRTVIQEQDGDVFQIIRSCDELDFSVNEHDLSHLAEESRSQAVRQLIQEAGLEPFQLSKDLMIRVSYLHLSEHQGLMLFNMHHIASDGWSMDVLTKEFFYLYKAYSQSQANPLPMLRFQYADYAQWQREYLAGKVFELQLNYWEKKLTDLPVVHSLPLDYKRPPIKQHKGAMVTGQLPDKIAKQLLTVAKQHRLTPFMLLHGALSLLLSRHSNSSDVVIGTPVANRLQAELEPLIGFFVNTLVLRVDTNQGTLTDYWAHIRQVNTDVQSNQDVPFEQLVDRLKVPRSSAYSPLFQIMLTTNTDYGLNDESDINGFSLPGVDIQVYQSELVHVKFDIEIALRISEQGVGLRWAYDVSLFTEQHITQMNDHLCRLLEGLSQTQVGSKQALHALPMLSADEIQHLVHGLNDTVLEYPKDKCIHELFEQQAEANPDHIALVFEETSLTYKQLNEKANQLAHYLKEQHDVKPDTLVGLCIERSLEMVIGILGILKSGGAYVPLDPNHPQERLRYMLEDTALDVVLSQTQVQKVLTGFNGTILTLNGLALTDNHFWAHYPTVNLSAEETGLTSSHLAYVIYTSGSTGQPNGVMIAHQSVNALTTEMATWFDDVSRVGWCANYVFDASVQGIVYLISGRTLVVIAESLKVQPQQLQNYITKYEVELLDCTPSLLQFWLDNWVDFKPPHLLVGGEQISSLLWGKLSQLGKQGVKIYNVYGPTECTVNSSVARVAGEQTHIGKTLNYTQSYVLSGTDLSLVPFGVSGELYLGGDGLARGYLNRPELTAERFIVNPFYDESKANSSPRLYKTGDLVRYLPDGNLEFLGRIDDQIKIRGFRIELGEVETVLAQLDAVDSALVMTKEVAGSQQLVGYVKPSAVVPETEAADYITAIRVLLAQQLPEYMVPGIILVVEEWPLTPNGKISRAALPTPQHNSLHREYVPAKTDLELILVDIWADILGIPAEKISVTVSFFELGGNSLLLMKLKNQVEKNLQVTVELQKLFQVFTVRTFALQLEYQRTQIYIKQKEKNSKFIEGGVL
jgi:amino acid adenylation domain-containing protein